MDFFRGTYPPLPVQGIDAGTKITKQVATRDNKHIHIDLSSRFFARNTRRLIRSVIGQVGAWTCLVIAR